MCRSRRIERLPWRELGCLFRASKSEIENSRLLSDGGREHLAAAEQARSGYEKEWGGWPDAHSISSAETLAYVEVHLAWRELLR